MIFFSKIFEIPVVKLSSKHTEIDQLVAVNRGVKRNEHIFHKKKKSVQLLPFTINVSHSPNGEERNCL